MTNWDRLELLLSQNQFEIVDFKQVTSKEDGTDCKVIYLMNDAVESFLVFKNVRYTGTYQENYEGEIEYSLDLDRQVVCIHQGESHLLLFFDVLELEYQFYNYGGIGHFWVKGNEDLRNLEYQIAIIHDKYEYLGEWACNPLERKLAGLKNFPPLNYVSYPAASLKYIVPMENPWEISNDAILFMESLCKKVGDVSYQNLLAGYQNQMDEQDLQKMTRKLAKELTQKKHAELVEKLYECFTEASKEYPKRVFDAKTQSCLVEKLEKAKELQGIYQAKGIATRIYREEPFVYDCDEITPKVYLMILKKGMRRTRVKVLEV